MTIDIFETKKKNLLSCKNQSENSLLLFIWNSKWLVKKREKIEDFSIAMKFLKDDLNFVLIQEQKKRVDCRYF